MANDAPSSQPLSSLEDWSRQHITAIFEAPTNELTLQALDSAFSRALKATVNGEPCDFEGFGKMIAAMAQETAPGGPRVDWIFTEETLDDAGHRSGVVKGEYFIRGIFAKVPGAEGLVEIEARKRVNGRIESQSSDAGVDSRRIVTLDATVNILPVAGKAP
ncbi:hypothetical protein MSAN_01958700 [Mycena sanguinolenta]|uniref:Uncharacterized protein n=1 Tax=Mycena sanguinolenta TaxID=230812 RepID=A0A8H6XNS0_9AGAR|nr:hypothetical protein MSAN_01958700 [Mycena sanguinolenta]